ncbi:unnamed protein product [Oppiella nova]|uniref:Uncharacterized protein n=1 Tax=Oppiella nova TaxID=334625 RepID=A0A7R9QC45_9ACAR|nr:unnamed protein product [Oppiella nova]CAG2162782.1 unnamed protein product [Oppiella nova]
MAEKSKPLNPSIPFTKQLLNCGQYFNDSFRLMSHSSGYATQPSHPIIGVVSVRNRSSATTTTTTTSATIATITTIR